MYCFFTEILINIFVLLIEHHFFSFSLSASVFNLFYLSSIVAVRGHMPAARDSHEKL